MTDALPWHHPTLDALAATLGVTVRSLELWRGQGAPVPAAAPFDELAVRLWHAAGPGARGGRRAADLAAPAGEPLATYCAALSALRDALRPSTSEDPAEALKKAQAEGQKIRNAERKRLYLQAAQRAFDELLARFMSAVERDDQALATRLVALAVRVPGDRAEAEVRRLLRDSLSASLRASLRTATRPG